MWYTILLDKDGKPVTFSVRLHEFAGDFATAVTARTTALKSADLNKYSAILVVGPSGDGDALGRRYALAIQEQVVAVDR